MLPTALREARTAAMLAIRVLHWGHSVAELQQRVDHLIHIAQDLATWVAIISATYAILEGCVHLIRWLRQRPEAPPPAAPPPAV